MIEINKIYCMDNIKGMKQLDDCSVDLTVTSPPYDKLRKYNGYSFDFENVARQIYRVTKDGGVLVWVVSDETKDFCESMSSFKQSIFFVEDCSFNLLDTMIYHKSNYAPAYPSMRRYANTFEYMFVFSKGKPKTFNPIQVEKVKLQSKTRVGKYRQADGSMTVKTMPINNGRNTKDAENVWTICPTKSKQAGNHPAVFPEELAKNHILSWSNSGDLVLDPFAGSGTTAKMAKLTCRNHIGFEISLEYCDIAEERLRINQ
jgi:DNA modification methylase